MHVPAGEDPPSVETTTLTPPSRDVEVETDTEASGPVATPMATALPSDAEPALDDPTETVRASAGLSAVTNAASLSRSRSDAVDGLP
jgi:hypothetical protein